MLTCTHELYNVEIVVWVDLRNLLPSNILRDGNEYVSWLIIVTTFVTCMKPTEYLCKLFKLEWTYAKWQTSSTSYAQYLIDT